MSENRIRISSTLLALFLLAGQGASGQEAFVLHELEASRGVVASGGYFPRMELLKNGDLLVAVKSGAAHVGKSGKADIVRSHDGGRTWSEPVTVFDLPGRDDAIDLLGRLSDGTIIAAAVSYTWSGETYGGEGWEADTYVFRSEDQGKTWSEPRKLDTTPFDWLYPFGRPVELGDGSVLLAGYGAYLDRPGKKKGSSGKWGGGTWFGAFRIPNLVPRSLVNIVGCSSRGRGNCGKLRAISNWASKPVIRSFPSAVRTVEKQLRALASSPPELLVFPRFA